MPRIAPLLLTLSVAFTPQLRAQHPASATALPEVNRQVLAYVDAHMGKRIGTGQCWDVAAAALEAADATWDGAYLFGRVVDPKQEPVLLGDVVQFEGVQVEYRTATSLRRESMTHHTAIVHAVQPDGSYVLAHQNFAPAGKKLNLTPWTPANVVAGTYTFFRPTR